jgi:hypothetical protein
MHKANRTHKWLLFQSHFLPISHVFSQQDQRLSLQKLPVEGIHPNAPTDFQRRRRFGTTVQ